MNAPVLCASCNNRSGQKVVLGLITTKQPQLENKEAVIARIMKLQSTIPLDRFVSQPAVGFAFLRDRISD